MKHINSNSNCGEFTGIQSQTTPFLNQPPTKANTQKIKSHSGLVGTSVFIIAVIISSFFLKACDADIQRNQTSSAAFAEVK